MKWIAIILAALTVMLAILYLAVGGVVLAIALGAIGLTAIIVSIFGSGIWYAHRSIQLGAKIATEAVNNNDRWDSVKMQSLAQFGGEIFKLKGQNTGNSFPLLESSNDTFDDASFTIQGVENDLGDK